MRLTFTARLVARQASLLLEEGRARALELARSPSLQAASRRRDGAALSRLLRERETVLLPASGRQGAVSVGNRVGGVPAARARVVSGQRLLATVAVFVPAGRALLDGIRSGTASYAGDEIALARGGVVVAGPAALRGARLGSDGDLRVDGRSYDAKSVTLPGYDPPARLLAVAVVPPAADDAGALRRRLALAALVSLVSIVLYAAALARPLLRSVSRVASVAEQAMIDPLTGLANRRGFEHALSVELERSRRRGRPLALVIVDLDDFKQVNDRHGHDAGDHVLVMLAQQLRDAVRSADTVARLGGEEFALLLPETTLDGALAVAEHARAAFGADGVRLVGGEWLSVTASFGAADFPASPDRASLVRDADQALYAAKRHGKNRIVAATRAAEAV